MIQSMDRELYNEIKKTSGIGQPILGGKADDMAFSVSKMDNGYLIVFSGIGGVKRYVAKSGTELLELIAGRLTETRFAESSLSGAQEAEC
jgi:hypothetical protein